MAKREFKETGDLLKDLQALRNLIRKHANDPAARQEIMAYLERIVAREQDLYAVNHEALPPP